jgi:hypothetical protein
MYELLVHESEREIVWWEKSGDENKDRFNWLKDNLDHKLNLLGKVWRYVWLGTSDLTSKNKTRFGLGLFKYFTSLFTDMYELLVHTIFVVDFPRWRRFLTRWL